MPILLLRKRKLRHSLGKPSRSDFVQLGFVEEIPCSISLNVSREEIYELQEEILDMEVTIYSYEDLLYKNPIDMTNDEKKTYKELKELEKRYNKFEPLERLFSYYLAINEKEN